MMVTRNHHMHAVDPIARGRIMNLNTTGHRINRVPITNLHIVDADVAVSGAVGIHHHWTNEDPTRGVAPNGDVVIEGGVDRATTTQIPVGEWGGIVLVIHTTTLRRPLNTAANQSIRHLMTIIIAQEPSLEPSPELRMNLKKIGRILGAKCLWETLAKLRPNQGKSKWAVKCLHQLGLLQRVLSH